MEKKKLIELNQNLLDVIQELRMILSQINVVKSISEDFSLNYVLEVEKEEDKDTVQSVANALANQAEKYGFVLDILPATTAELQQAKQLYAEHLAAISKFKA